MALSKHSERNLSVIENFILHYTHGEQHPLYNEMMQSASEYIEEDHVDGEGSEETTLERARIYLVGDDTEILSMIEFIRSHEDQSDLLEMVNDYISVVEAFEFSLSCEEFLKLL
jgi:hypothetical protein